MNEQLPAAVQEEINEKAELSADFASNEGHTRVYLNGYKQGWKEGATAYATKLHEAQQENEQLKTRCDKMATLLYMLQSVHSCQWSEGNQENVRQTLQQWQQWKEGRDKEKYDGSVFSEPAPGITLGCISPEARELLDTIMEAWGKHYAGMKEMHGDAMPETTFYGFAYWLGRWSGLIQPALTNPPK